MNSSSTTQAVSLHKNDKLQLLCFYLEEHGDIYAINVFKVKEIIKYKGSVTKVTYEDSSIIDGLITIRGLNIPLIDMRKWFYFNSNDPKKDLRPYGVQQKGDEETIMICEFSRWTIGVKIHQADRILNKKWEEIEHDIDLNTDLSNGKFINRTQYFDDRLVQIVDIEKMLIDVFPWIESEKQKELETLQKLEVKKTVLLADDSPVVIKTMQNILDRLNVKYHSFYNGKALLDFLNMPSTNSSEVGLIITDLEMPEMSGFDVIRQVKSNPLTASIPIVVNSSMSGSSNEDMAMDLDANGFVSKSNPKEIEKIIKFFLECK